MAVVASNYQPVGVNGGSSAGEQPREFSRNLCAERRNSWGSKLVLIRELYELDAIDRIE